MVRGYERRQKHKQAREVDKWRRTRLVATILLNAYRDPKKTSAYVPEKWLPLLGDILPEPPKELTPEEVEAEFARTKVLDADLV
ncbi:MAG: hypothetical protein ACRYFV_13635 [Janthinobacterium lividum]